MELNTNMSPVIYSLSKRWPSSV